MANVKIKEAYKEYLAFWEKQKQLFAKDVLFQELQEKRELERIALARKEAELAHTMDLIAQRHQKDQEFENLAPEDGITKAENTIQRYLEEATIHQKLLTLIDRIENLVSQHKETQQQIKTLQEREQLLNDLYRIFSKEIMIKVLEDALPAFAEYINNILAKLVPFTIHFLPTKTSNDKLELEITVRDIHGERPVKSLSGGQKTIVRLARILWVAQMTRTKQLFLDETINNIDHDTISNVAEMLEDYIKSNDISLYLVTHSLQLQAMNIWDKVILLEGQTNE